MKSFFLLVLAAGLASAQPINYTSPAGSVAETINASLTGSGTIASPLGVSSSSGTLQGNTFNGVSQLVQLNSLGNLALSTATFSLSGAGGIGAFPYTPLAVFGNANTYLQEVMQNLSNGNNASSDLVLTNDLGGDTSYYLDLGVNSSKFSQAAQTVEKSSSTFLMSSDADLVLWADTNGALNGGTGHVLIGSSVPVTGNQAMDVSSTVVKFSVPGNSPAAIFSPVLSSGTVSAALSGTFTNTTLGLCVASSTGSMTLPQVSEIRFDVHCTISVASLAAVIGAGVIVDGGFIDGETAAKGATAPQEAVSTDGTNLSFTVYASGLSAASHSYCFSPFVSANTGTIDSTNSVCHLHAHMMP